MIFYISQSESIKRSKENTEFSLKKKNSFVSAEAVMRILKKRKEERKKKKKSSSVKIKERIKHLTFTAYVYIIPELSVVFSAAD